MALTDITARLAAILEANKTTVQSGLAAPEVYIEPAYPYPHFGTHPVFVHREGISEMDHARYGGPGAGTAGEIDGTGNWVVAAYVKVPGLEEVAQTDLDKLVWNLLTVLRNYYQDAQWLSMLPVSSSSTAMAGQGGAWFLGERLMLRIKWTMVW